MKNTSCVCVIDFKELEMLDANYHFEKWEEDIVFIMSRVLTAPVVICSDIEISFSLDPELIGDSYRLTLTTVGKKIHSQNGLKTDLYLSWNAKKKIFQRRMVLGVEAPKGLWNCKNNWGLLHKTFTGEKLRLF